MSDPGGADARKPLAFPSSLAGSFSPTPLPRRPRDATTSPRSLVLPLSSPRLLDPDGFHRDAFDDRDIFSRHVADQRVPTNGFSYEKSGSSPRAAARVHPPSPMRGTNATDTSFQILRPSLSKMRPLVRPHSPVSDLAPEAIVTHQMMQQISPRGSPRKAILAASDTEKINAWLRSLKRESNQYSSYFLYCETLLRESESLLKGKATPNRLQTAVAFHCLSQATGIFARHEDVLSRICRDLGAAIFVSLSDANHLLPWRTGSSKALEYYADELTYYDQLRVLKQQRDDMERDLQVQMAKNIERAKEEKLNLARIKDLEARYKIRSLEQISQRNTVNAELNEKLREVLQSFQYMDESEKQRVVLGVIEALRAHITSDTLISITEQISHYEKDKLLRELFQDDIAQLTEKIRSEVVATSSAQQNAILERSAARITRFQTLIWDRLRSSSVANEPAGVTTARSLHDDDDLCDQDRKVLESINDVIEELHTIKRHNAALEEQIREAEQVINNMRWRSNAQLNEAQDVAIRHAKEIADLREEFAKVIVQTADKEVQTDRSAKANRSNINAGDEEDEDTGIVEGTGTYSGVRGRRRRGLTGDDDDDLIVKNRRLNQYGFGIASIIEQARIPSSKIRKILAKRKPLTLNELHAIIVGYYQAKMFQDAQDDNVGKTRSNLAQFIMDMYTLHYGLKDLAISQLVFLDASIRKHATDSVRVRTFGLLTGSLEPESHACSVQGIDFFLFVVVVMFNAGIYKRGRKQSVHVAQNLKSFFGEGIFMSPKTVTLKSDVICNSVDLIFSYMRNDPGGTLDKFKEEVRALCTSHPTCALEVDVALEKIMNYWFTLYEQQIVDINAMFALVDTNGDGTLDFREFCEVVHVLEPGMDRREALSIYNKAAGDDHVIDKDEFVQVMLAHQRGTILKEFYNGESTKKSISAIQQRKPALSLAPISSSVPASSLQYKTVAGGMAHLDREESYASLVAAMSIVTESMSSVNTRDEDGDEEDGGSEEAKAGGQSKGSIQENVSYMALSRLSVWASEAKDKLIGVQQQPSLPLVAATNQTPRELRTSSPVLARISEQSKDSFERDVDNLLEEALAKANIDIKEVV